MTNAVANIPSDKSTGAALLMCVFLGTLGVHRFYVGKIGTGVLQLITFGGLGIWSLIDAVLIALGEFTDKDGRKLPSTPRKGVVFLLCYFLGILGVHRFYVGKIPTGIIMLLTFGGFFIWYLIDIVLISVDEFKDKNGHTLLEAA